MEAAETLMSDSQSDYRQRLYAQLVSARGRLQYTATAHEKDAERLTKLNNILHWLQIALSATTAGSFLIVAFPIQAKVIGAACSTILCVLSAVTKNYSPKAKAQSHRQAADQLWSLRERYESLLCDFTELDDEAIRRKRDDLSNEVGEIYKHTPRTTARAYHQTKKALQRDKEQTFDEDEAEQFLPPKLRYLSEKSK
ncbi:hypothetical protein BLEM_0231 [Bifidobacterium lemurum]|uniref:SMODS and SLOG-associating 2TM effector domain-containing protein n=2 Tax=Bifidobacterium lemurum TaxID=1603886 RepID=A0A261FWN3_9BIFI|nr:hypothetical protein BLEM_0231 [Bifidobacterium lemurum]